MQKMKGMGDIQYTVDQRTNVAGAIEFYWGGIGEALSAGDFKKYFNLIMWGLLPIVKPIGDTKFKEELDKIDSDDRPEIREGQDFKDDDTLFQDAVKVYEAINELIARRAMYPNRYIEENVDERDTYDPDRSTEDTKEAIFG